MQEISSNISFIVQGKIQGNTKNCLESIRQFYPKSTIILSTWENENTVNLVYDTLVKSKDPGGIEYSPGSYINLNRQITSTLNGLKAARTEFSVKIRTDTQILNQNLLALLRSASLGKLFNNKIVALDLFFRDPRKFKLLFHIGDIFLAGKTNDLLDLWDIKLAPEPETSSWNATRFHIFNAFHKFTPRYTPEQYIFISLLNKKDFNISLDYCCEINLRKMKISEKTIADNFELFSLEELGINIPSRLLIEMRPNDIYTRKLLTDISHGEINEKKIKSMIRIHKWRLLRKFIKTPSLWLHFIKCQFKTTN